MHQEAGDEAPVRLTAKKPLRVKGAVIGGEKPLICVPVVAEDEKSLVEQALQNSAEGPDLIEWRADFFRGVKDVPRLRNALGTLRGILKTIPLVFTLRSKDEGGAREIPLQERITLIMEAITSNIPDIVDVELSSGEREVRKVLGRANEKGVAVILSHHDFHNTPPAGALLEKIILAQKLGGSIAKVAVMPRAPEDVLSLFNASLKARREVDIPVIAVAMGNLGTVSRVAGCLFGSDVTFAEGALPSAPGQIPVAELRRAMNIFLHRRS